MVFVKSVLAGVGAVIAAAIVATVAIAAGVFFWGGYVGAVAFHGRNVLCAAALIFAFGFWWQWRKAK
jgi:hypothetical protein